MPPLPPPTDENDPTRSTDQGGRLFTTTRWSLLLDVGADTDESQRALNYLCSSYWSPVYFFIRRGGKSIEEAQDLTQGFFASMLERGAFSKASQDRGRFRSFLLASAKNFVAEDWRWHQAKKRGGRVEHLSLDLEGVEQRFQSQEWDGSQDVEVLFDRQWAVTVVEKILEKMRDEHCRAGTLERFEAAKPFLLDDPAEGQYRGVAAVLEMSESGVRSMVKRLRDRFGFLFQQEIAQTVADPAEVLEEVRYLASILQ